MKITFLGTGAADWPIEKIENMTEFRRLSSVLIDDTLLIDPGPQIFNALNALIRDLAFQNKEYFLSKLEIFGNSQPTSCEQGAYW